MPPAKYNFWVNLVLDSFLEILSSLVLLWILQCYWSQQQSILCFIQNTKYQRSVLSSSRGGRWSWRNCRNKDEMYNQKLSFDTALYIKQLQWVQGPYLLKCACLKQLPHRPGASREHVTKLQDGLVIWKVNQRVHGRQGSQIKLNHELHSDNCFFHIVIIKDTFLQPEWWK